MVNNDPMINSTDTTTTTPTTMPSALPPEKPKEPGKFGQILRGIVGGALNIVAPGVGSLISGFIGGGPNFANMEQMLMQQQVFSLQMLSVQNRVQTQTQEFTTVSNLLKARHDGEMSAVNNFKS